MHCQEKKEAATREGASLCLSQEPFRHSNFNWVSFSTEMERGRERITHKRGISGKRWNSFFYKKVSYKPKQLRRTSNIPRGMDRERERERERERTKSQMRRKTRREDDYGSISSISRARARKPGSDNKTIPRRRRRTAATTTTTCVCLCRERREGERERGGRFKAG